MEKSKKFRMPAGIRNKLMAAVAMLLVSSIMMVSSTYAWFTLSTAPEVTGITTSVGANGNLEIALLNGQTYADMTKITSSVGDSSVVKEVKNANITWGNLVDLSDAAYGLNLIALNPAALNLVEGKVGETLLKTAEYGADGRVADLKDNTISGVYNTSGKWVTTQTFENDANTYAARGVRAIGVDSNMSTAQIAFNAAVSAVNSGKNSAASPVVSAVAAHEQTFLLLAMSLQTGEPTYDADDYAALKAVAEGVQTSLKTIVKTYSNAILAKLATTDLTDEELTLLRGQLSNEDTASDLVTLLNGKTGVEDYTGTLSAIAAAQGEVATVLNKFTVAEDGTVGTTATDIKAEIIVPLIGNTVDAYDADGGEVTISGNDFGALVNVASMYLTDGLVADVAVESGTYKMCSVTGFANVTVYAGANDGTTGNLADVAGLVAGLTPPSGENAEQTIADFYGYILDFAFRTNAASSSLQLQTAAANRVYTDGGSATQGAGSTATFAFDSNLNEAQVRTLLGAVNLVFLNPVDGTVHATATLTGVEVDGNEATAEVKLAGQTGDVAPIVALAQNTPTAVSVLVYLDGNSVDNGDVANAASSGVLNLNLQFSSSAELVPMKNTALQNMTAYTVSFNANGGTGFMQSVKASGETYTVPTTATFTRTGYTFKGWSTETAGAVIAAPITLEGDTTLYAIWEQDAQQPVAPTTYTVSFNANFPENATWAAEDTAVKTMADVTDATGTYNLPACALTAPDGYTFGGWALTETVADAAEYVTSVTGEDTVYAIWVTA